MLKEPFFYRKIPFKVLIILLSLVSYNSMAQSVKRQCISSYGMDGKSASLLAAQTAGQPYNTSTSRTISSSFLPGFLQPASVGRSAVSMVLPENFSLVVYPNPASDDVIIQSQTSVENAALTITDISGKPLIREEIPRLETYTFNCSRWPSGIYFVTLNDRTGCKNTVKLIINK